MEKHLQILALLYIVLGIVELLASITILFFLGGIGVFTGEPNAVLVLTLVGSFIAFVAFITSVPGIIGGFGLLKKRSWARMLLIIVGILSLPNFPLGTILGIYTLWVLFNDETVRLVKAQTA